MKLVGIVELLFLYNSWKFHIWHVYAILHGCYGCPNLRNWVCELYTFFQIRSHSHCLVRCMLSVLYTITWLNLWCHIWLRAPFLLSVLCPGPINSIGDFGSCTCIMHMVNTYKICAHTVLQLFSTKCIDQLTSYY